jgi:hypothetical protein
VVGLFLPSSSTTHSYATRPLPRHKLKELSPPKRAVSFVTLLMELREIERERINSE